MDYREIGRSGLRAGCVGLGCWTFGGKNWGGSDERESIQAIHRAVDVGMNLLDTAPFYGVGYAEEVMGRALKGRRDKAILATKCGLNWDETGGEFFFADGPRTINRNLAPASIARELEKSLRRLQTDRIDLYQTHWQTPTTPPRETMAALLKMKEQGKIRAIGVSNASPEVMDQYRQAGEIDSNQPHYSMLEREIEQDVLPYCLRNGISILAYSPLAKGLLTGAITPERRFTGDDQRATHPWITDKAALKRLLAMLDNVFRPIAAGHGITLAQLAIAWTVAQPGVTFALCGARTAAQVDENARGGDAHLSVEEIAAMRRAVEALEPPGQ